MGLVYLPTFTIKINHSWIGKYTFRPMEFSNIPLEHTPHLQPTVYDSEFFSCGGLGMPGVYSMGMLGFS